MNDQEITEKQKLDVKVNSKYLEVRSQINSSIITEFLNSSTVYWKQTVRGLFLLHGACATAIIASGNITQFKYILVVLAFGALCAVIASLLISSAQIRYSTQYIEAVMLVDLQLSENIQSLYSKEVYDNIIKTRKQLPNKVAIDVFRYSGPACWFSVACFFLAILMFLKFCDQLL